MMMRNEILDRFHMARWDFIESRTATPRQLKFAKSGQFNRFLVDILEWMCNEQHGDMSLIGDEIPYVDVLDTFLNHETARQALDADNNPVGLAYLQALDAMISIIDIYKKH